MSWSYKTLIPLYDLASLFQASGPTSASFTVKISSFYIVLSPDTRRENYIFCLYETDIGWVPYVINFTSINFFVQYHSYAYWLHSLLICSPDVVENLLFFVSLCMYTSRLEIAGKIWCESFLFIEVTFLCY